MSEGVKFKTGFLGPNVSYGDMAKQISDGIIDDVNRLEQARLVKQERADRRLGFTRTLEETVPAGLTNKYSEGAQLLLQDLQAKSSKAYQTGVASDIQAYQAAKKEYNDYKNIAVTVSAFDSQTRVNIMNGKVEGMIGTKEENLQRFREQDVSNVRFENGRLVMNDGTYWRESGLSDVNNVYMPQLEWEPSKFMIDPLSDTLVKDKYLGIKSVFQKTDPDFGLATGELKLDELYPAIQEDLENTNRLNPQGFMEAAAVLYHKAINKPGKAEFSEEDYTEATSFYNVDFNNATITQGEGENAREVSVLEGKFNNEGDFIFTLTDDELEAKGLNDASRSRKAYEMQMEETARLIIGKMGVEDKSGEITALRTAQRLEKEQDLLKLQAEKQEADAELVGFAPALFPVKADMTNEQIQQSQALVDGQQVDGLEGDGFAFRASVGGQNFDTELVVKSKTSGGKSSEKAQKVRLNNVILDDKGDVAAYTILKAKGEIDIDFNNATQYEVETVRKGTLKFKELDAAFKRVKFSSTKPNLETLLFLAKAEVDAINIALDEAGQD
tara:strand:+ start:21717 stop:23384 length:1668 start_codon:yes stop_codon:yes gene_type:complete